MSELDDSFAKLLGRQPSDKERQDLYRVRDALGIKNNDALWLILMALQHYESLYASMPTAIAKATQKTLDDVQETADAAMQTAATQAKAGLAKAVSETAQKVASQTASRQMWQWVAICIAGAAISFGSFGWFMHHEGYKDGYANGDRIARQKIAAAAWATTSEGLSAYKMSQTGTLLEIETCNQPGWQVEQHGRVCIPSAMPGGTIYGWQLP